MKSLSVLLKLLISKNRAQATPFSSLDAGFPEEVTLRENRITERKRVRSLASLGTGWTGDAMNPDSYRDKSWQHINHHPLFYHSGFSKMQHVSAPEKERYLLSIHATVPN